MAVTRAERRRGHALLAAGPPVPYCATRGAWLASAAAATLSPSTDARARALAGSGVSPTAPRRRGQPAADNDQREAAQRNQGDRFAQNEYAKHYGHRRIDVGDQRGARGTDLRDQREIRQKRDGSATMLNASRVTTNGPLGGPAAVAWRQAAAPTPQPTVRQ